MITHLSGVDLRPVEENPFWKKRSSEKAGKRTVDKRRINLSFRKFLSHTY